VPLSKTEVVAEFMRDSTHKIHLAGKPLAMSVSNTMENSTRSKAFSKSSFRITISLLDWWHWCRNSKAHPRQSYMVLPLIKPY
jgi:hypothetical protein